MRPLILLHHDFHLLADLEGLPGLQPVEQKETLERPVDRSHAGRHALGDYPGIPDSG